MNRPTEFVYKVPLDRSDGDALIRWDGLWCLPKSTKCSLWHYIASRGPPRPYVMTRGTRGFSTNQGLPSNTPDPLRPPVGPFEPPGLINGGSLYHLRFDRPIRCTRTHHSSNSPSHRTKTLTRVATVTFAGTLPMSGLLQLYPQYSPAQETGTATSYENTGPRPLAGGCRMPMTTSLRPLASALKSPTIRQVNGAGNVTFVPAVAALSVGARTNEGVSPSPLRK